MPSHHDLRTPAIWAFLDLTVMAWARRPFGLLSGAVCAHLTVRMVVLLLGAHAMDHPPLPAIRPPSCHRVRQFVQPGKVSIEARHNRKRNDVLFGANVALRQRVRFLFGTKTSEERQREGATPSTLSEKYIRRLIMLRSIIIIAFNPSSLVLSSLLQPWVLQILAGIPYHNAFSSHRCGGFAPGARGPPP
jgi:hypothetical protein